MSQSKNGLMSCLVLLGVLLGIVGGGVMGGLAGYYAGYASQPTPAPAAAVRNDNSIIAQPILGSTTNLTLKEDSAVIDAVRKVKPAVVTVVNTMASRRSFFGSVFTPTASGSGVIIDPKGLIVTNNHVVAGQETLQVIFSDGTKANATIVGTDSVSDIAIIRVNGSVPAAATWGDSNALEPGQVAIAIGSPLGSFQGTVTVGVVSALNRKVGNQQGLIQTDAAINNGNSGGPLINAVGQVIGINTLVVRSTNSGNIAEGLGFAIPSNLVRDIAKELISKGSVEYPYIGIGYVDIDQGVASALNLSATGGILVTEVDPNSPGARAGLAEGDVILALDSSKIDENHSLTSMLFQRKVGAVVTLTVLRDGRQFDVKVTLGSKPG